MFSEELEKISWEETTRKIYAKTEADVLRALSKSRCDVEDFMALISPAAEKFLEPMARLSRKYTEERFGKTMSMFIPLYITNSCTNSCVYCGFHDGTAEVVQRVLIALQSRVLDPQADACEDLAVVLEGRADHPQQGIDHDEADQDQDEVLEERRDDVGCFHSHTVTPYLSSE